MDLNAANVYGFGQNPQADPLGVNTLPVNTSSIPGKGFAAHWNSPLFWLLILALVLTGIIGFSASAGGKVKGIGSGNIGGSIK